MSDGRALQHVRSSDGGEHERHSTWCHASASGSAGETSRRAQGGGTRRGGFRRKCKSLNIEPVLSSASTSPRRRPCARSEPPGFCAVRRLRPQFVMTVKAELLTTQLSTSTLDSTQSTTSTGSSPASSALPSPPEDKMLSFIPPSVPQYTFPAFLLTLLTALESDPSTIQSHLANLTYTHAAPSAFQPSESRPHETDAVVASLSRIAERLQAAEGTLVGHSTLGRAAVLSGETRAHTPDETIESVKISCEEHLKALKTLHAEELRRSQVSHDEEVRSVCQLAGDCAAH